jgi:hypothetical protein
VAELARRPAALEPWPVQGVIVEHREFVLAQLRALGVPEAELETPLRSPDERPERGSLMQADVAAAVVVAAQIDIPVQVDVTRATDVHVRLTLDRRADIARAIAAQPPRCGFQVTRFDMAGAVGLDIEVICRARHVQVLELRRIIPV